MSDSEDSDRPRKRRKSQKHKHSKRRRKTSRSSSTEREATPKTEDAAFTPVEAPESASAENKDQGPNDPMTVSRDEVRDGPMSGVRDEPKDETPPNPDVALGAEFWDLFRLPIDLRLDPIQYMVSTLPWPSKDDKDHYELEFRIGHIMRSSSKRLHPVAVGPCVIPPTTAKLQFNPSVISPEAFQALRSNLCKISGARKSDVTGELVPVRHEMIECDDIEFNEHVRVVVDRVKRNYVIMKKDRLSRIDISMRELSIPSADVRVALNREATLRDEDIVLSDHQLKTQWRCRREKTVDRFVFGCWAVDLAVVATTERVQQPDGKWMASRPEPEKSRLIEIECLYAPNELEQFINQRGALVRRGLHIARAMAAAVEQPLHQEMSL